MTKPQFAQPSQWGRRVYRFPGLDYAFPSVTTVIGEVLRAPALEHWKIKQTALRAYATRELWQGEDEETAAEIMMALGRGKARSAAGVGTLVHEAIENFDTTGAIQLPMDDELLPYLEAASENIKLLGKHYATEITLVNQAHGYAGTADVLSFPDERPSILRVTDWKTCQIGKSVGWHNHSLQLAALASCGSYVDADGEFHSLPAPIEELSVIGLRPDGSADRKVLTDQYRIGLLSEAFLGLLDAYKAVTDYPGLNVWAGQRGRDTE
jgi:hypothetical protein